MDESILEGAEKLAESVIRQGIAQCRTKEPSPSKFDGSCGCGEPIPDARIGLGYYRCVDCQARIERVGK